MQDQLIKEAHFNLGRLALKLLSKRTKQRKIQVLGKWSKLIKGILSQQDLMHKVKTLNILRWELVTLKLM